MRAPVVWKVSHFVRIRTSLTNETCWTNFYFIKFSKFRLNLIFATVGIRRYLSSTIRDWSSFCSVINHSSLTLIISRRIIWFSPFTFRVLQLIIIFFGKLTWKIFFVGSLNIHLSVSLYEMTFMEIERYP